MIPDQQLPLWIKILQFPLDDETAAKPFSGKLAMEQNWTPEFTQRAIAEYRRFLFLCCISPSGAAPSQPIDEVWHQHLTYTQSYWVDLCQGVLGRELHHFPSAGGPAEDAKHREWYRDTLRLYRNIFDAEPPADVWATPPPEISTPELPRFNWNSRNGWGILALMVLPFLFIWVSYGTLSPFSLGGQHFLIFFAVFSLAIFASYMIIRLDVKKTLSRTTEELFPAHVSPFQIAAFLYGKHRGLQAGIVDLIKRGLLEVMGQNRFLVKKSDYVPDPNETNPLIPAFSAAESASQHSYEDISGNWYDKDRFTHPALDALDRLSQRKEPFLEGNVFAFAFFAMALIRIGQGVSNGKPVTFLFIELAVLSIVFFQIWKIFSLRPIVMNRVKSLYQWQGSGNYDETVSTFALQGTTAITGFAEGALLIGLFNAAQPPTSSGWSNNWSSGDSDSGSSGSSCGSGGSSCGGCSGN